MFVFQRSAVFLLYPMRVSALVLITTVRVVQLIQQGESGGQEASRLLVSAVNEYIRGGSLGLSSDLAIVIRIYANLKGLARTYKDAKVLADGNDLEQFVRGFNKGHPLADIADAGQGKECSDEKIRGMI